MINFFVKIVADTLVNWCIKKNRVYKIIGDGGKTTYLVRYIVYKGRFGCIYIHRFMRSDASNPHCHPWNFWTYVISGGYHEVVYDRSKPVVKTVLNTKESPKTPATLANPNNFKKEFYSLWSKHINIREPGSIAYRRANDIHQVVVDKERTMDEIKDAPYTICFMGPRVREWGFWPLEMKGSGFLDWREYLNIKPNDSRIEGSE
jgi:hypothetical protein